MRKVFYFLPLLLLCAFSFAQPGTLDNTYHGSGKAAATAITGDLDQAFGMAVYPDGKVVLVGVSLNTTEVDFAVVRYDATGALDVSFGGGDGIVKFPIGTGDDIPISVAIQPSDNKIVIVGYANMGATGKDIVVVRLNVDGSFDTNFDGDGIVTTNISGDDLGETLAIQPDGKILVGGNSGTNFAVLRYNTNGALDLANFGGGDGIATRHIGGGGIGNYGYGMALQPDGHILLSGFTSINGEFGPGIDIAVLRFDDSGLPDATFGSGAGFVTTDVGTGTADQSLGTDIALQTNGSFYVTGSSNGDFATLYYNSDGTLNNAFGGNGKVVTNISGTDESYSVYIQSDNRVVVAGASGNGDFTVIRYNSNGTPDINFGGAGTGISATDINSGSTDISFAAKLSHSRIYVAGAARPGGGDFDFSLIVLQNDAQPLPLKLLSFAAQKQNNDIAVSWKTEKEESILQFTVERSADGRSFSPIGVVTPSKIDALVKSYTFIDKQPLQSINYYRLAIKEVDEKITNSKVVAIKFNKKVTGLEIYPNPVIDNTVRMQLPDGLKGRINLQIVDGMGRLVKSASLESAGGSSIATSMDISSLKQGMYFIQIVTSEGVHITKKILKK